MERGLAFSCYEDYENDAAAFQGERDFVEDLPEPKKFEDLEFPADARACYFDPFNPPKGYIPGESLRWLRISDGNVERCVAPVTYAGNKQSQDIMQGALGNKYFINALRLIAGNPKLINRCLISDTYASRGIYTCKFYKAGRWRYVHVDDRIPCRPCGAVNFCRNKNPNEIFAMIIEKAYAKLHGCYEAICFGLVELALQEFVYGGFVSCIKTEVLSSLHLNYIGIKGEPNINDIVWDSIENALNNNYAIGCIRTIAEDQLESVDDRSGIALDYMYQVVDLCVVSASTTATMAELTVGMVCVKNIQPYKNRFKGRWGLGNEAWALYPEIATALSDRTKDLQRQLKNALKQQPLDFYDEEYKSDDDEEDFKGRIEATLEYAEKQNRTLYVQDELVQMRLREADSFTCLYSGNMPALQSAQPMVEDLHWIQIEDFVETFNRVYVLLDQSLTKKNIKVKSYSSKWIPDDFIAGASGPPIFFPNSYGGQSDPNDQPIPKSNIDNIDFQVMDKVLLSNEDFLADPTADVSTKLQKHHQHLKVENPDDIDLRTMEEKKELGVIRRTGSVSSTNSNNSNNNKEVNAQFDELSSEDDSGHANDVADQEEDQDDSAFLKSSGDQPADMLGDNIDIKLKEAVDDALPEYDWASDINDSPKLMNPSFSDNPMYPFTVNEVCTVVISLYQSDKKWASERVSIDANAVPYQKWVNRHTRLISCMKYPVAIGFVIVRLFGAKMRCTEFRLKKIVGQSAGLQFLPVVGNIFNLKPGRYAIIPYTHIPLEKGMDYLLQCQYIEGQLDFELEDIIKQKMIDSTASDSDSDDEIDPFAPNNSNYEEQEEAERRDVDFSDPVAKMEWEEKVLIARAKRKVFEESIVFPPVPQPTFMWEYSENFEDKGFWGILEEVGYLAQQMRNFGSTIEKVKQKIADDEALLIKEKEEARKREEELQRREKQRRKIQASKKQ